MSESRIRRIALISRILSRLALKIVEREKLYLVLTIDLKFVIIDLIRKNYLEIKPIIREV